MHLLHLGVNDVNDVTDVCGDEMMIFDLYKMISGVDQLRTRGGEGGQIHHLFNAKIQSNIFLDSNILSLCIWILIVYLYL